MQNRRCWALICLCCVGLSACALPQPVAQAPRASAAAQASRAAATADAPRTSPVTASRAAAPQPTEAPTLLPTVPSASDPPPASATSAPSAVGDVVLRIPAGSGKGEVGVTANAGPPTFRVAADGSIRVMDAVNKRLLFFNGSNGALDQTIDLSFLQQPTDFVVTGKGDLYVLDAGGWTVDHLSISGKELHNIPINPSLKTDDPFTTISLTADGRIFGLTHNQSYLLITANGPLPVEDQLNAKQDGVVTVRSNASFTVQASEGHQFLNINDLSQQLLAPFDLGSPEAHVTFLDVNQGMEPYVVVDRGGGRSEVRRYTVQGDLIGTLLLDQSNCRPAARRLYIDRPGDVYTLCVSATGATIMRYVMTDAQGQPLPRFDRLVSDAPWSPGNLQAAPG